MHIITMLNEKILWGIPMTAFMLFCGIYLTLHTHGIIFRKFFFIMSETVKGFFSRKNKKNGVSPFSALSAALAATAGTGNITGVALAIYTGGPGAVFWMWIAALFGMVIKYSEVTLAVKYREKNDGGKFHGGPMYYIKNKKAAYIFCIFAALSSFGIGNAVQANSLAEALYSSFGTEKWISGIFLAALACAVLMGGAKRIFSAAEVLVPFMALFYIVSGGTVLLTNSDKLADSFQMIFRCAFSPAAPVGGFCGASVAYAIRTGIAKGLFSNEAGLGSAPIAHAAADTDHPARQGMYGAFEVFFDTIIMCTLTSLVILSSGIRAENKGTDAILTAFSASVPYGGKMVSVSLALFAFASIIAWYYYGEQCICYVFGKGKIPVYRILYTAACFFGCVANVSAVWEISDTLNSFMAIPNLAALIALAPEVNKLTSDFFARKKITSDFNLHSHKDTRE